ncbi:MAG: MATE family efflux transporter [Pseudomonadales bacterium]
MTELTQSERVDFAVPEWRALLSLGWPMMATQFFIMATGFLDTVMAGRYGAADLAGVHIAGNVMWPLFLLLTGVTMALTPIVSQLRGADQLHHAATRVRQGLWLSAGTSLLLVLAIRNTDAFYEFVGLDAEVIRVATGYLQAVSWGIPAVVIYVTLRQVCEGLGNTVPPMIIAGSVLPVNAVLNYGLIYGRWGLPELGGVGCGYATAVVFWLELLMMLYFVRRPFFKRLGVFDRFERPRMQSITSIVRLGAPIGFSIFLEMAVFSVISLLIGRIGVVELAAHSVVGNINWLTYVLPMGLGAAAGIRVGYFVGRDDLGAARHAAAIAMRLAFIYGVLVSVLLVLFRAELVSLYTKDAAVIPTALALIVFVAIYQIVDDANAVAIGALRGYKDTQAPMYYGLIGFWIIALPLGVALAYGWLGWQPLGVYGYWSGLAVGLFLVAMASSLRLWRTSADRERIIALSTY